MRSAAVAFALAWLGYTSMACADDRPSFPGWDLEAYCRTQANYSFAATLGESSVESILAVCEAREGAAKAAAAALWPTILAKDAAACLDLADGKYSWLAHCLNPDRLRTAR